MRLTTPARPRPRSHARGALSFVKCSTWNIGELPALILPRPGGGNRRLTKEEGGGGLSRSQRILPLRPAKAGHLPLAGRITVFH
ncbi:hypothetical protein GCM10011380_20940 [Sphingomonas metalli]|uniref:Uncharacterized protein n=1 Tax=Sphingomonas metalli TaxID=1779358 RepID=A0A916T4P6_9SPHN|nr:hypothetical protein GCM10011380_20940 [Sphingomonas metalli]